MNSRREFGHALRRERERHNVRLETIAKQTKISTTLLAGLERGDCSRWPAGIYSRAWIREYAQAIGVDPEETATTFGKCFVEVAFPGEPDRVTAEPSAPPPLRLTFDDTPRRRARRAGRRSLLLAIDLTLVLTLAAALSFAGVVNFWMMAAILSLVCHAVGLLGGDGSAAAVVRRVAADPRRPEEEPASASSLAEAV